MRIFRSALLCLGVTFGLMTTANASMISNGDSNFEQGLMKVTSDSVIVISSFEDADHLTSYTYYGFSQWDRRFSSKILSWQISGDYVFVFSKSRVSEKTYLICLDKDNGNVIWLRP